MNDSQALREYAKELNRNLRSGGREHTHRPALRNLLNYLAGGEYAFNEARTDDDGDPDFVIRMRGVNAGFVECKDVPIDLGPIEIDSDSMPPAADNGRQLRRYRTAYKNLLLTNYHEIRWFRNGSRRGHSVRLLEWDGQSRVRVVRGGAQAGMQLIRDFLRAGPQPVDNARELAERLAALTRQVRDAIVELFESGRASAHLRHTKTVFENTLMPDLEDRDFADMYAQTVAYGLFVARVNFSNNRRFDRTVASRAIPPSIPFLRRVFDVVAGIDLDEELYAEVVDDMAALLRSANLPSVLRGFGQRTATQDPALHFYETYLAHYDPEIRETRGVYYTPAPVVSYIVRSVDYILRTHFDCPNGLADDSRIEFQVNVLRDGEIKSETRDSHKVLILDPACGTGTFLSAIVELVRDRVASRGLGMWEGYVRKELLPRLFGFELMMAPYTVAHFNLWMHLQAQEQLFAGVNPAWNNSSLTADDRIRIYLTNSLEPSFAETQGALDPLQRTIVTESEEASKVKTEHPIMVVIGNPPYSGHSENNGEWITRLMRGDDGENSVSNYFEVDGSPLKERNSKMVSDDYVKFLRFGQWRIERSGAGILAFVTNHAWLDNPTFRGVRQSLLQSFDEIYVLDLHGNTRKGERDLEGHPDENVFDIQQGVAIGVFVKRPTESSPETRLFHADLFGNRWSKYSTLRSTDVSSTSFTKLAPRSPMYLFVPENIEKLEEYEQGQPINQIFKLGWPGITTGRDKLNIHFTAEESHQTMTKFADLTPEEALSNFNLRRDTVEWRVALAQADVRDTGADQDNVEQVLYRPFDNRYMYYTGKIRGIMSRPRVELKDQMTLGDNIGMITTRGIEFGTEFNQIFCAEVPITQHAVNLKETNHMYPLYIRPDLNPEFEDVKQPNLSIEFVNLISSKLAMIFIDAGKGDLTVTLGPENVFDYIYGILHSLNYRKRYIDFLKSEFPRIPVTERKELFRDIAMLGERLRLLHLLKISPPEILADFPVVGDDVVGKVRHSVPKEDSIGKVFINKTQFFGGIPLDVWDARIGGYQPARKYLTDRRGRVLTYEEKELYIQICSVLAETQTLMSEIDAAIDRHGGWPIT